MNKTKILFSSIFFPLFMGRYFLESLLQRNDVDLISVGPFTGNWIPWKGGMNVSSHHIIPPTISLPFKPNIGKISYPFVKAQLPDDWVPDIVLTVDAGLNWIDKPSDGVVVTVATDGHCLNYDHARSISDKFFNMHYVYRKDGDLDLPYAYSSQFFYPMTDVEKDADAVLIGLPYDHRQQWVNELRSRSLKVLFENGPIFDEYRILNNHATMGLNWSSMQDLNCRAFEIMGMRLCPVMNRVPDLERLGFEEGRHYLGFDNLSGAIEKVMWAKEHSDEREMIANVAYQKVTQEGHTYDSRVKTILEECGYAKN